MGGLFQEGGDGSVVQAGDFRVEGVYGCGMEDLGQRRHCFGGAGLGMDGQVAGDEVGGVGGGDRGAAVAAGWALVTHGEVSEPWRGECDEGPVIGLVPEVAIGGRGGHGDDAWQGGGIEGLTGGFIAGGGDENGAALFCVGEGIVE